VDLVESTNRVAEILERGHANDVVERGVGERHVGHVALPKVDLNARAGGVLACDSDERAADVQSRDLVAPKLR